MDYSGFSRLLVTPEQMRALDRRAIRDYKIPGLILMENAAAGIAEYIRSNLFGRDVLIMCGRGNNGGDGFAAARKLHMRGVEVFILALASREEIVGDAKTNLDICERLGVSLAFATADTINDILPFSLSRAEVVVDALFGTGFRGIPGGVFETAINAVNDSEKYVVAIDTPSGLDSATGIAAGVCVRANVTLALGLIKTGLLIGPSTDNVGEIELVDIGIPPELPGDGISAYTATLVTSETVTPTLARPRRLTAHKGDFGKALFVTGAPGMTGAGCLAADSALASGVGLVYLAVPGSLASIYETAVRESITLCAGSNVSRTIDEDSADAISNYANRVDAVAIGPGLSTEKSVRGAVRRIVTAVKKPLILDADALTAIASDTDILLRAAAPSVILTPHEGEMARLLGGVPVSAVTRNRLPVARDFAVKHRVTLVLKGHRTIVAAPDGRLFVNNTGNPGMATAGSGDVLTGMITALAASGINPTDAAIAAVHTHGLAGDLAAKEVGERSLRAANIIHHLPDAYKSLSKKCVVTI